MLRKNLLIVSVLVFIIMMTVVQGLAQGSTNPEEIIAKLESGEVLSASEKRILMKHYLATTVTISVPGVNDAISARLAEEAGFPVLYIGSYAIAASQYGRPDCYMITWSEMADKVRSVVNAVNIPVFADGENGWIYPTNARRVVQAFEQAGAVGIHIEDTEFGKHTDLEQIRFSKEHMVGIIRAAVNARVDPNFLIIARCDVPDPDESVERMQAYLEAGADMVFPTGALPSKAKGGIEAIKAFRDRIDGPFFVVNPGTSEADNEYIGLDVILHYDFTIAAAYPAVKAALERLMETKDIAQCSDLLSREGYVDFIGTPDFTSDYYEYMKPYMSK